MERRWTRRGAVAAGAGLIAGCIGDDDDVIAPDDGDDTADGDDDIGDPSGLVFAFAPSTVAAIDPAEAAVVAELSVGPDESWGDPRITADDELFAIRQSPSQVVAIDPAGPEIVAEVDIGPGPVHLFAPREAELWAHADEEGTFYVLDTNEYTVSHTVPSGRDEAGHGKLVYHDDFGDVGFATNVTEPGIAVLDMAAYERTGFISFGDDGGTHYKAYSPENGRLYVQRTGVGETAVVEPEERVVVDSLPYDGGMYLAPDGTVMALLDGDTIRFLDVTDPETPAISTVTVEDAGPDTVRFHEADDGLVAFTAPTMNDRTAVIDVEAGETIETLGVGDIERPEDARFLHRTAVVGDGYFMTPADADGTVAIVDMDERSVEQVTVEPGVDTLQFVGDSGPGYTGRRQ